MSDISIENLYKSFSDQIVLQNLNLNIKNGERICIMGSSGCGKTTLLNILLGFESPDNGTISGIPDNISVVFQENRLCEDFSALSNVRAVLKSKREQQKAISILNAFNLGDSINKPIKNLSGGMKRRVAIARALVAESDLLILDEPFKGLDDYTKTQVMQCLAEHLKNKTVILVTHDESEAIYLKAKIYHMKNGQIDNV